MRREQPREILRSVYRRDDLLYHPLGTRCGILFSGMERSTSVRVGFGRYGVGLLNLADGVCRFAADCQVDEGYHRKDTFRLGRLRHCRLGLQDDLGGDRRFVRHLLHRLAVESVRSGILLHGKPSQKSIGG